MGDSVACIWPASVLAPQMYPELSVGMVLKEPAPLPCLPRFSSVVPCSAAPGWARWGMTTGWDGPAS